MNPSFSITAERSRKLLRVTLSGFFDVADVHALEAEKLIALRKLGTGPNQHYTLVDVSGCKLQPQDVVQAFQRAIGDQRYSAKRIAFVTGSSLARMQVRRMLLRDNAMFFDTLAAAEKWLFQDQVAASSQAAA